jgi:predicted PurR-regulated permease PerM
VIRPANDDAIDDAMSRTEFVVRVSIVFALVLVPILILRLFDVILIGVGALLIATALKLGSEPFIRLKLPQPLALILSGLLIIGLLGGASYLFGTKMAAELQDVLRRVEAAQGSITQALHGSALGKLLLSHVSTATFSLSSIIGNVFSTSTSLSEAIVVGVFAGVYLAIQPNLYRRGFVNLMPHHWRANALETIDHIGQALRLWLLGQIIQMILIGVLAGLATFIIGLPSPFALGLIAGVAEFIPYLGPILSAVPALLVAATAGVHAVLWTLVAYFLIHQIEGELIAPLVQRRMVSVPPVVFLMSVVTLTYLFGWIAIIFAAPLVVIICVIIIKLYIRDCLGDSMRLPGESGQIHKAPKLTNVFNEADKL